MNFFISLYLKDDGILVIPTVADPPSKLLSKEGLSTEVRDRAFTLLSIASLSGCCQVLLCSNLMINVLVSLPKVCMAC